MKFRCVIPHIFLNLFYQLVYYVQYINPNRSATMKDNERANSSSYNITAIAESRPDSTQAKVYINYDNDISTDAVIDRPNDTTKPECHHQKITTIPQKDLISHSAESKQTNPSEQLSGPSFNEILDIIWKFALAIFLIGIGAGFSILNTYAEQIKQKDLILEIANSSSTFVVVAIMPFIASLLVACAQVLFILAGVQYIERSKDNTKSQTESNILMAVYLLLGVIILVIVFLTFPIVVAIAATVASVLSFLTVMLLGFKSWFVHIVLFVGIFCTMVFFTNSQIRNNDFRIMQSFGVAEKVDDAQWYILHSTSSNDTINGMTKNSVELFRLQFNQDAPKNDYWSKTDHALFGHMVWNIGNERVLCNTADQPNKKCIRIPKENIQLAPDITNDFPFDPSQVSVVPNSSRPETITKIPGVEEIVPANIER